MILLALLLLIVQPAHAHDFLAVVSRIVDGDTLTVDARLRVESDESSEVVAPRVYVRLRGLNAPERGCAGADAATARLKALAPPGEVVILRDIASDKYGGRVVARIIRDGLDVGDTLLAEGLVRPYGTPAPPCR